MRSHKGLMGSSLAGCCCDVMTVERVKRQEVRSEMTKRLNRLRKAAAYEEDALKDLNARSNNRYAVPFRANKLVHEPPGVS